MRTLSAALILVLLFSCNSKKKLPYGILEPQKMQSVFWDYIRADVYAKDFIKKDSSGNDTTENIKLQNKVFNFYNISRKDFYKSYDYYAAHPDLMNVLMDSMLAKQNRIKINNQAKASKNRPKLTETNKRIPIDNNKKLPEGRKRIIPDKKAVRDE